MTPFPPSYTLQKTYFMELCKQCPARDERYIPSDQQDKKTIRDLMHAMAVKDDFIEFLFEHSEHCDHITYNEAWEEFQAWQEKENPTEPNEAADTLQTG